MTGLSLSAIGLLVIMSVSGSSAQRCQIDFHSTKYSEVTSHLQRGITQCKKHDGWDLEHPLNIITGHGRVWVHGSACANASSQARVEVTRAKLDTLTKSQAQADLSQMLHTRNALVFCKRGRDTRKVHQMLRRVTQACDSYGETQGVRVRYELPQLARSTTGQYTIDRYNDGALTVYFGASSPGLLASHQVFPRTRDYKLECVM
ncbi:MAG: hypothetical protein MHM6MM_001232 [Cercozoa sp. M6MM]